MRSNLVVVPVSVTDASGRPVRDLKAEDFRIEEEGNSQKVISLGEPGKTPLDLALLFDVSASVSKQFQFEQQAASAFLKTVLRTSDTVSVFSIGSTPKMIRARTSSAGKASAGLSSLTATREATAFYDSVVEAARYLGTTPNPGARRVLVVISDGEDNNSERFRLPDTLRELQRNDCIFYSINPSGPAIRLNKISMKGQEAMTSLAAETGGAFVPAKPDDLEAVFRQIAAELQAQYLLGYYSTDSGADGVFRRITVRLSVRPELRVRARRGYYSGKVNAGAY
ncbi:MAG TPA: VWA domain-containing protein [Acidobacteriota bacterium]